MFFKYIYENDIGFTCFDRYFEYIKSIRNEIPDELFQFASDENRYNLSSKHSLHDSWLNSLIIREQNATSNNEAYHTNIEIELIAPYHDKKYLIVYKEVQSYLLDKKIDSPTARRSDLLCHEFRLKNGLIEHAIEFDNDMKFLTTFRLFEFQEIDIQ